MGRRTGPRGEDRGVSESSQAGTQEGTEQKAEGKTPPLPIPSVEGDKASPPPAPKTEVGLGEGVKDAPVRKDQRRCPNCGKWGCPQSGRKSVAIDAKPFTRRYYKCKHCRWIHTTRQAIGRGPEIEE